MLGENLNVRSNSLRFSQRSGAALQFRDTVISKNMGEQLLLAQLLLCFVLVSLLLTLNIIHTRF